MLNLKRVKDKALNFIKTVQFIYYIGHKDIFGQRSPKAVLMLIEKFLELQVEKFPKVFIMGRDPKTSLELLKSLNVTYSKLKASSTLDQILEVIKNEFIERENYGRKQF